MSQEDSRVSVDKADGSYDYSKFRVYNVNGTKVLVGLDQYGYVSVETGKVHSHPDTGESVFHPSDDSRHNRLNLSPSAAQEVAGYIEELAE